MPYLIILENKDRQEIRTTGKVYYTERYMKKEKRKIQAAFEKKGWDHMIVREKKI